MSDQSFWFVWNEKGAAPRFKHPTQDSAVTEAKRLARLNKGEQFIVMQSVCMVQVTDIVIEDLRPQFDELPF